MQDDRRRANVIFNVNECRSTSKQLFSFFFFKRLYFIMNKKLRAEEKTISGRCRCRSSSLNYSNWRRRNMSSPVTSELTENKNLSLFINDRKASVCFSRSTSFDLKKKSIFSNESKWYFSELIETERSEKSDGGKPITVLFC